MGSSWNSGGNKDGTGDSSVKNWKNQSNSSWNSGGKNDSKGEWSDKSWKDHNASWNSGSNSDGKGDSSGYAYNDGGKDQKQTDADADKAAGTSGGSHLKDTWPE